MTPESSIVAAFIEEGIMGMFDGLLPGMSLILIATLMIPLAATACRMNGSPADVNGFVAIDTLTSLTVAAGALASLATGWRGFLDIGFGFALIGFVATSILAALLERRGRRR